MDKFSSVTPPKSLIFYGWWVVLASVVGLSLGISAIIFVSFGVFISPLEQTFGWSRAEISVALTLAVYTTIVASILVGWLLNRWSVRRVLIVSIVLFGLTMASMALLSGSIWHLYAMYIVLPVAGAATLPVSYSRVIVAWFNRKRGLALGIGMSGVGIAAVLIPPFIQHIIDAAGWRSAYIAIALLILCVSLPVVAFVLRDKPEDLGLLPDGDETDISPDGGIRPTTNKLGWSVSQVLRSKPFWLMAIAFLVLGITLTGIMVHLIPLLVDRGMTAAQASYVASILGVALLIGRLLAGYLMDRYFAPYVAVLFLVGPVLGFALFAAGATGMLVSFAAILIGLAVGAEFDVIPYFTSRYFGLRHYSQIYGILYAVFLFGAGVGPLAMGIAFDRLGEYTDMLWAFSAITLFACVLILLLGPYPAENPRRRAVQASIGRTV